MNSVYTYIRYAVVVSILSFVSSLSYGGQYNLGTLGSKSDGLLRGYCDFRESDDQEMTCFFLQIFPEKKEKREQLISELNKIKTSKDTPKKIGEICSHIKSSEVVKLASEASESEMAYFADYREKMMPVCDGKLSKEKIAAFVAVLLEREESTCKFKIFGGQDYPIRFQKTGNEIWTATDRAKCKQSTIVLKRTSGLLWSFEKTSVKINNEGSCKESDDASSTVSWTSDRQKIFRGGCKWIEFE